MCIAPVGAQLIIDNSVTAAIGVQNILLGGGVTVSNITFTGANEQVGSFNCTNCNLGIESGLVLGSGNVTGSAGPNNIGSSSTTPASGFGASDPDLAELSGFALNDAAVLIFDFIPTGDSLAFNFVFGSDEYPEFANSTFNDAFGFFLSGPGISGPYINNAVNIAFIPGTTVPLTINNLNNGTSGTGGPCEYCQSYIHNGTGTNAPNNLSNYYIQADGFTTVLTASAQVQCGETYRIKLAIADAGDTSYDSWVFLQAGSFQSNQLQVAYAGPNISPGLNSIYEGCQPGMLTFTRPEGSSTADSYTIIVGGTAEIGLDFDPIPASIEFPPFVSSVSIPVIALADGITEGVETVIVTLNSTASCSNSPLEYTVEIMDLPPLSVALSDVVIDCGETATLTPIVSGGIGFYSISWPGNVNAPDFTVSPQFNSTYNFVVTDTCGVTPWLGEVEVSFPNYPPISVELGPDQSLTCLESLAITPQVSGGFGVYTYSWTNAGTFASSDVDLVLSNPTEGNVELQITDECGAQGNGVIVLDIPSVPVTVDLGYDLSATCLEVNTLSAAISGGVGAYTYQWTQAGGIILGSEDVQSFQTNMNTSVSLVVTDECGNQGDDVISIALPALSIQVDLGSDIETSCLAEVEIEGTVSGGIGEYSYAWTVNGQASGSGASLSFVPGQDALVELQIVDECGNASEDELNVTIPPVPVIASAGPDLSVTCLDETVLTASAAGGVGNYSYVWNDEGGVISNTSSLSYQTLADANIIVTVTDECGNIDTDEAFVSVPPVPIALQLTPDTIICQGNQVWIEAAGEGGVGDLLYTWLHDGSNFAAVAVSPGAAQTYTVTVSDQCGNSNSGQTTVSLDVVEPGFTAQYIGDFGIQLTNQSNNAVSYLWYFGDGTFDTEENPTHIFFDMQPWQVTLEATGTLGCAQSVTHIFYPEANIYVPNCFTPDNDFINDVFQVEGHDLDWFRIWIFSRWGDLVYYSESLDEAWDGSHQGKNYFVPDGQFVYRIEAQGIRGNIIEKKGSVLLIR